MHESQHPLTVNHQNDFPLNDNNNEKKQPRKHRRGSRSNRKRSTSCVGQEKEEETNDNTFIVVNRRKSTGGKHHHLNHHRRHSQQEEHTEVEESPAFQSLQDIISEMKRLPLISVTPSPHQQQQQQDDRRVSENNNNSRRGRRFSEPFHLSNNDNSKFTKYHPNHHHHHYKDSTLKPINEYLNEEQQQQQQQQKHQQKPIFSNSFVALESSSSPSSENEKASFVSHNNHLTTHQKRTRSQSVPNNLAAPNLHHHQQQQQTSERKPLYPVHLSDIDALPQVRAHKLFSGILRVDWQDSSDANVECEELDGASIYIYGSRNRNRAIDGDEVVVELVDVDTMLMEKQAKKQARHTRRMSHQQQQPFPSSNASASFNTLSSIPENNAIIQEDNNNNDTSLVGKPKYCGKVVCILERPRNMLFSGTLSLLRPNSKTLDNTSREKKTNDPKIIWFIPADKRLPLVAVPIKHAPTDFTKYHEEYHNRIFVGNITRWPVTSLHPFGTIVKEIGWMGELDVHLGALMADHHLKDDEFSDSLLKACAAVPPLTQLSDKDIHNRRDLRDLDVFTIGDSNTDTGHAFSISFPEKDVIEVGIHVPDVIRLVKTGNPFDREMRERICTVKLVNKKIPVLPSSFIESHFSLMPDKERLGYSVMCRFTEGGVLLHCWIGASVIKSKRHYNFDTHSDDLQQQHNEEKFLNLCRKLQKNRINKNGHLSLAGTSLDFDFGQNGYPTAVHRVDETNDDIRVLLQEILIIANVEVGQKISSRFPDQALLVRQEEPKMSKLELVQDYFENNQDTGSIQGLLKLASEETDEEKKQSLAHLIFKCITPQKFFSAGSVDISKYSYFSLGAPIYALFTEPTQHYASVIVQRQLQAALKGEEQDSESFNVTDKIARHCNGAGLSIRTAEQESRTLYTAAYIYRQCLNNQPMTLSAYVVGIHTDSVITIYIPEFDLEMPLILNQSSLPGHPKNHCEFNSTLHEMKIIWYKTTTAAEHNNNINDDDDDGDDDNDDHQEEEEIESIQVLKFLSLVDISIGADMKVVKPVLLVELLH